MTRSLSRKLILAFVLVSVVGVLSAVFITRWLTVREFQQFVLRQTQNSFIELVTDYYEVTGTWQGVAPYLRSVPRFKLPEQLPKTPGDQQSNSSYVYALVDPRGIVVIPAPDFRVGTRASEEELAKGQPLMVNGQFAGTVIATGNPPDLDPRQQDFLDRTNLVLLYTGLGSALAALILGIFLAHSLTKPLEELTGAIRAMSSGQLGQQVPVRSKDEIGELAMTFNQMTADLERLNEQRVQMTADIAHDLRTPLTVLGGYLEAMQDKVLDPTPERLETMHIEIQGLIRLVEDLRTLSLADSGELPLNRSLTAPGILLNRAAAAFELQAEEAGVDLQIETHPSLIQVHVDPERFHQVLSNLVANAIRHTNAGGRITLAARPEDGAICFEVRDTG